MAKLLILKLLNMAIFYYPNISFQFKKFRLVQGVLLPLFGKSMPADPQYQY